MLYLFTNPGETTEDIENLLFETCYCPGDEYTKLIPELNGKSYEKWFCK